MKLKTKIFILSLTIILAVGAFMSFYVMAAEQGDPSVNIETFSLSLENAVYINFKVSGENISNVKDIKLLAWDEAPEAYDKATADYVLSSVGTEAETGYEQFKYTKLSAKEMTKMVYACAYYNNGENEVYSSPVKFSVAMYADMQRAVEGQDEKLLDLIDAMLGYGAMAQIYFDYNTDFLATDEVSKISVVNGTLDDGFDLGWYQEGAEVTLIANETEEGYKFSHWENSAGENIGDTETLPVTVGKDDTYTAVYERDVDYFVYTELPDGTYSIEANPEAILPAELIIPSIYNGRAVTKIKPAGFKDQTNVVFATIPNSVTEIGVSAFEGCSNITKITLPFVGYRLNYTQGSTNFGWIFGAGKYTQNSTYVPEKLRIVVVTGGSIIPNYSFYGCANIERIVVEGNVTTIGESAFGACKGLQSIDISQVRSIGRSAFSNCSSLKDFVVPDGVTSIENFVFSNCVSLANISLPNTLTSIGASAFIGCYGLENIIIPDSVTSIGNGAFCDCNKLISIDIPNGVSSVENNTFAGCTSLVNVELPESVTSIGDMAFSRCHSIKSIEIPQKVTYIGIYAFSECINLVEIELPQGITTIKSHTFVNSGITHIIIPEGVVDIESGAFYKCSDLISVEIPNTVINIGDNGFYCCVSLKYIYYTGTEEEWAAISKANANIPNATIHYNYVPEK